MDMTALYATVATVAWLMGLCILLFRHPLRRRHHIRVVVLLLVSCVFLTAAIIYK